MSHDEWYSPPEIIEPIREFYGGTIDNDLYSCESAQKIIQAKRYCTITRSRTVDNYHGNVWASPPYCNGAMQDALLEAARQYKSEKGQIHQMIFLVNRSDAKWYYNFLDSHKGGYYQFRKRIKFIDGKPEEGKKKVSPRYQNDLIYWGNSVIEFQLMCKREFGLPVPATLTY